MFPIAPRPPMTPPPARRRATTNSPGSPSRSALKRSSTLPADGEDVIVWPAKSVNWPKDDQLTQVYYTWSPDEYLRKAPPGLYQEWKADVEKIRVRARSQMPPLEQLFKPLADRLGVEPKEWLASCKSCYSMFMCVTDLWHTVVKRRSTPPPVPASRAANGAMASPKPGQSSSSRN